MFNEQRRLHVHFILFMHLYTEADITETEV